MSKQRIAAVVFSAIDEVNEQQEEGRTVSKSLDSVLFGKGGRLNSLGLVNLIIATEEKIADEFGVEVALADERALSLDDSPFRTVGSLVDYIVVLLAEKT